MGKSHPEMPASNSIKQNGGTSAPSTPSGSASGSHPSMPSSNPIRPGGGSSSNK